MSRRINVMIDDDTWRLLEKIPAGERSRTINEALRAWAKRRRRRDAVAEMDALRSQLPDVSTAEVVKWIREDRDRAH
jgi:predicted CopG family antitoxin